MTLNGRSISGAPLHQAGGMATAAGTVDIRTPLALVSRAMDRGGAVAALAEAPTERGPARFERIAVRAKNRILFLDATEVAWLEAYGNYVRIHVRQGTSGDAAPIVVHTIRGTLSSFESRLDPVRFVRIHRSVIVNVDVVRELHSRRTGDFTLVTRSGEKLTLSRNFRNRVPELRRRLAS